MPSLRFAAARAALSGKSCESSCMSLSSAPSCFSRSCVSFCCSGRCIVGEGTIKSWISEHGLRKERPRYNTGLSPGNTIFEPDTIHYCSTQPTDLCNYVIFGQAQQNLHDCTRRLQYWTTVLHASRSGLGFLFRAAIPGSGCHYRTTSCPQLSALTPILTPKYCPDRFHERLRRAPKQSTRLIIPCILAPLSWLSHTGVEFLSTLQLSLTRR